MGLFLGTEMVWLVEPKLVASQVFGLWFKSVVILEIGFSQLIATNTKGNKNPVSVRVKASILDLLEESEGKGRVVPYGKTP